MKRRLLLDIIVSKGPTIFELLTREDETLLIGGNTFFILDFSLDIINGIRLFNF